MEAWSGEEVAALLEIWPDDFIQSQLEGMRRNNAVYVRISERLKAKGVIRTFAQCRTKIKALKTDYKKVADNNNK